MLWGKGWPEVARGTGRVGVRARAAAHAGRAGAHPPRRSIVLPKDQGALARAPTRPAPSALPRSAFAAPARTALCACGPLAILTVPACSLGRRATAGARGGMRGGVRTRARARVKPPGWCLCAASVRRVRVFLREFTNPHTNTHKHTARAAENALELTIDLRGGGVAVEEWMRGGGYGGKGDTTGSERGGESARCRGCQGDAPRGPGARWRRRGGRLLAVRRRPKPAKTRRAAAQSEAGRGAGEWVGFKVQGVG